MSGRLGRLEEKMQDLQVSIGTLESLLRTKPGTTLPQEAPAPVRAPTGRSWPAHRCARDPDQGADQPYRADRHADERARGEALSRAGRRSRRRAAPSRRRSGRARRAPPPSATVLGVSRYAGDDGDPSKPRWYGAKPGSDELADCCSSARPTTEPQSLTAALPDGDAQTLYQQGYGALLQKDYAGAEGAFSQLVDAYPNDPLAGNAQYWLGETYYVRGQYKNAADAFLKGYKK